MRKTLEKVRINIQYKIISEVKDPVKNASAHVFVGAIDNGPRRARSAVQRNPRALRWIGGLGDLERRCTPKLPMPEDAINACRRGQSLVGQNKNTEIGSSEFMRTSAPKRPTISP
ncbi:hypothetical protein WA026_008077 [Henosepilachna vigintioctopunctata]|uniref:Uncharacterized protein n=1 Tax=Henosepilachna vigintioctopunctata TaxID=420089 RepID=A0AAW1TQ75_9CUCU